MAAYRFTLPDLGEGIAEGEVVQWHVEPGQWVDEGDRLLDVETEKAVVEIPSPATGRVGPLLVEPGVVVAVGTELVAIETEGKVSPRARRVARELGVDVGALKAARDEHVPVRGVRGRLVRHLTRVQQEVPAVTVVEECDFTALDALLEGFERTAFLLKAVSTALEDVPELNATFVDVGLAVHDRHDVGLAVQTANGLIVPVVRGVDDGRDLGVLADEVRRLTDGARENALAPTELKGSTFTVTEAGQLGGLFATPLVNAPEVGVLGIHRVGERPVARDGEVVIRRIGNVSCTFDHRAVDGFQASAFLLRFAELVQQPEGHDPPPGSALGERLAALGEQERPQAVLELVLGHAAALIDEGAPPLDPRRAFKDLGFDSRMAVELRNRLARATGLRLPSTLLFDHPTPESVAERVLAEALGRPRPRPRAARPAAGRTVDEPMAIVGIGCRYPGGVRSASELWDLVASETDAISRFPDDRGWELDGLPVGEGGFIHDAGDFDAEFFGIGPREALAMDPQQRLLLETAWEALEDAGIDPTSLRGDRAGVFAGVIANGYGAGAAGPPELEGYRLTGTTTSVAAGRLAYTLGLEGPALTVDTACSSSLVAIHLACQALRAGECTLALAGGAAVMATPELFLEFSRQGGLAPDGRCKSFAAAANGTAWSEGVGLLVLERLSDARRAGHEVLALVRGSAINQDGASNGLTAPSGPAQERLIAQALADAGVSARDVDAVEAHGTGTTLGDPIEAQALLAAYGGSDRAAPLPLGSIKSNIGHSSAAAGVAGVIKMAMAMRHGQLPRTLHIDAPTPHADWAAGGVELLAEAREWPRGKRPRRAGVSSFGISGTNAHLVLEEVPGAPAAVTEQAAAPPLPGQILLPLSAKSEPALREVARRLRDSMERDPALDPADVAFSLATARAAFDHRAVAVGADRGELLSALAALAVGGDSPGLVRGQARAAQRPVFLFPGQGGQWPTMALELLDTSPAFARHIDDCEQALAPFVDWSLKVALRDASGGWLRRLDVVQPALFAVSVSLAKLWRELGVEPSVVVGHSQGEIAAAHIAGGLSLQDAARAVAVRGKAVARIAGQGGMAAVALSVSELQERLGGFGGRISLAATNGSASQVVSGDPEALDEFVAECASAGVRAHRIAVDYAAHSAQIEKLKDELLEGFGPIEPRSGELPFHSTVTSGRLDTAELDTEYWYRNLREPVRLEPVLRSLLDSGQRGFVEVGAHPVLAFAVEESADALLGGQAAAVISTLRRGEGGPQRFARSLASAWTAGIEVDWGGVFASGGAKRVRLPSYPFQRRRYWVEGPAAAGHPLLDAAIELPDDEGWLLAGRLSLLAHPWLADHAVDGAVLLPGTAFLELALHAAATAGLEAVEELVMHAPLTLTASGAAELRAQVGGPDVDSRRPIAISSRTDPEGDWTRHATGTLAGSTARALIPPEVWPPKGASAVALDGLYDRLAELGYRYGPAFQGLAAVWRRGEEIFAEVGLEQGLAAQAPRFGIHPALLDAALHAILATAPGGGPDQGIELPFSWEGVTLKGPGAGALRVVIRSQGDGAVSLGVHDQTGAPVAEIASLRTRLLEADVHSPTGSGGSLVAIEWVEPAPRPREDDDPFHLATIEPDVADDPLAAVRATVGQALAAVQGWLGDRRADSTRLVIVTRNAVSVDGEAVDVASAPLWGLLRSVQREHPGRFVIVDVDGTEPSLDALPAALATGETQLALRAGAPLVPRLHPLQNLAIPLSDPWRLDTSQRGALASLSIMPARPVEPPLEPMDTRVSMRAAGLNFRDVLIALGIGALADARLGGEGAGIVIDVGSEVTGLAPGDRVMGLAGDAFRSSVIADRRLLAPIPEGWSFRAAAAVPGAFLTAHYALIDLAGLQSGERVLIHAGAGGVGLAAIQVAHCLGAEVFATASPAKWDALRAAGVADDRMASSRDLGFRDKFLASTGGEGVDVVLNSLANEFVDASLELLPRGGRFVEMGKTDVRDPEQVAAGNQDVFYRAFELGEVGPDRLGELLRQTLEGFDSGGLRHLPRTCWSIARAPEAFRHLREGRNVGKVVLDVPAAFDPDATVLITGGTGGLGAVLARHLVEQHGARRLLLVSRRGGEADGAAGLRPELERLGAEVDVVECDVAARDQLVALLSSIPDDRPLGMVIHAAGVLDDHLVESIGPEQVDRVFAPKVDGAWHLHELTKDLPLSHFVMFSSIAGTLGSAGQASYAAANAFLDALAQQRHAAGLPATSIAWGLWERPTGMTSRMDEADRARTRRMGAEPLSDERALELFDAALRSDAPVALAASRVPMVVAESSPNGRDRSMLDLVRSEAAGVLGHRTTVAIPADKPFKDLGFDSLAAVELRNRLGAATGLRLDASVVFAYPSPAELAEHLLSRRPG